MSIAPCCSTPLMALIWSLTAQVVVNCAPEPYLESPLTECRIARPLDVQGGLQIPAFARRGPTRSMPSSLVRDRNTGARLSHRSRRGRFVDAVRRRQSIRMRDSPKYPAGPTKSAKPLSSMACSGQAPVASRMCSRSASATSSTKTVPSPSSLPPRQHLSESQTRQRGRNRGEPGMAALAERDIDP